MENPEVYGPRGLGLKPSLFDGNTGNMGRAGVNLIGDNEMLIYYQTPWVSQSSFVVQTDGGSILRHSAAKERGRPRRCQPAGQSSAGGIRNLPLPVTRGRGKRGERLKSDTTYVRA